jgi:hypothetical protein
MRFLTRTNSRTPIGRRLGGQWMSGFFIAAALLTACVGCEKTTLGLVDNAGQPPFLRSSSLLPDSVKLTSITPVNGLYSVSATIQTSISFAPGGDRNVSVTAIAFPPSGVDPVAQVVLHDDAVQPDVTAGDNTYTGQLVLSIPKTGAGPFVISVRAVDGKGLSSNAVNRTLFVLRNNAAPVFTNLVAPDTVNLPAGGTLAIKMTAVPTDADGQLDVREVYFRSLDSSDPTRKFFLLDDGGAVSGDTAADDGTYTITVQLADNPPPAPSVRKTYRFAFQALDAFGDTSATLLHPLTVR